MSEKIFILCQDDLGNYEIRYDDKIFHFLWEVAPILNEQQSTINSLQQTINELESILADDIVRKSEIKDAWKQRTEKRWNDE